MALIVLMELCDGVVLSGKESFTPECIMVSPNGVKLVYHAEIHQAKAIPD